MKDGRNNLYITVWFYVVSGLEAKWSNLAALKSSLQPHGELHLPYAKVKHLTAQFADESVEYTKKGISIQYAKAYIPYFVIK